MTATSNDLRRREGLVVVQHNDALQQEVEQLANAILSRIEDNFVQPFSGDRIETGFVRESDKVRFDFRFMNKTASTVEEIPVFRLKNMSTKDVQQIAQEIVTRLALQRFIKK